MSAGAPRRLRLHTYINFRPRPVIAVPEPHPPRMTKSEKRKIRWLKSIRDLLFFFSGIALAISVPLFLPDVSVPLYVLILVVAAGLLLLTSAILLTLREKIVFINAPVLQADVKVSKKDIDSIEFEYYSDGSTYRERKHYYFITFAFPDKTTKTFKTDMYQYKSAFESDTGTLTYKEKGPRTLFIDFAPA